MVFGSSLQPTVVIIINFYSFAYYLILISGAFTSIKMMGPGPIMVLSQNTKRDSGKKVQLENINAGKTIGDVVRTCLGK